MMIQHKPRVQIHRYNLTEESFKNYGNDSVPTIFF